MCYIHRILISSIRNLGNCPCPRCLIPLSRVCNLGMARDKAQRISLARTDNIQRHTRVYAARKLIYEKNHRVNSAAVESMLREMSFVPNAVSDIQIYIVSRLEMGLLIETALERIL